MDIKTRVMADLARPSVAYVVYAKQWDKLSRYVDLVMYAAGVAWTPPTGATYEVRGIKPDNTVLKYSVDEAENDAVSVSANVATITLAQQALACPGDARIELCIKSGDEVLTSFAFVLRVEQSALADIESNNYINPALTTFIPSVSEDGIISWTNDGGLDNPEPRDITGPSGAEIVSTQFIGTDQAGGNIYRQTFDNGVTAEFIAPRGPAGTGNVSSVARILPDADGDVPLKVGTDLLESEAVTPAKMADGAIPIKASVTLDTSWSGTGPYTHAVSVSGYTPTANSKVDIQPEATSIAQLVDDGVSALYIVNSNGTLTAYAVGEKPTASLTLQITIEEVR